MMVASVSPTAKMPADDRALEGFEFFPDGIVLEAEWEFSPLESAQVMEWRRELGSGVSTEDYLTQVRRALHLRRLISKREIRHIHATRSNMVLCAWIVHRLSGISFSMAVEDNPDISRSALDKIAGDAALVSRADYEGGDDLLQLSPPQASHLKVGPLKIRQAKVIKNTGLQYDNWVEQLLEIILK